ncbi:MAG TPA: YbdK family carboxylate-amine ligase [Thermoleophilaceae bacterium]|nr:YbdK family carboxylate-amine ligase [Thermoleophilaceae bacterium]
MEDAGRDDEAHGGDVAPPTAIETDAASLRAAFDGDGTFTVGIEEELMTLDPETLDLAPVAAAVIEAASADGLVKGELPAAQLETVTGPAATVGEVAQQLARRRRLVARACAGLATPAAGAVHPFTDLLGTVSEDRRYQATTVEYGEVARLQLVFGLHVHVRAPGVERALAVYNALRSYLPELAALAANAPFLAGRDTGMASVRPKISELLPRQGVPPALASWDEYADAFAWGRASGGFHHPRMWWWELRPHPGFGTLELRVPDQQTTVGESAAIAAVAQSLVASLAERHDAGEALPVHPTWRIEQNRWSAARHGLAGMLADLDSGEPRPTRDRVAGLLDELAPVAARLGCSDELADAVALATAGGSDRLRAAAAGDPRRAAAWLADHFLAGT